MAEYDKALRPKLLKDFLGQDAAVSRLRIAIDATRLRGDELDHVLLSGPAGLGKTTTAQIIANELGRNIISIAAPAIRDSLDLLRLLLKLNYRDILFIDEIHRLSIEVEEFLYSAVEDWEVSIVTPSGPIRTKLAPFTLIGATTRAHELTAPLRSRLGLQIPLDFYRPDDLAVIVKANAVKIGKVIQPGAAALIAQRARGTPRIANNLLRRARDFADVKGLPCITIGAAESALAIEGVDSNGLNDLDRAYLQTLSGPFQGGPAGVNAIAATLDRDPGTLSETVEPYLLRTGLIVRAPRGRKLTPAGSAAAGIKPENNAAYL